MARADHAELLVDANEPEDRFAMGGVGLAGDEAGGLERVDPFGLELDAEILVGLVVLHLVNDAQGPVFDLVLVHGEITLN